MGKMKTAVIIDSGSIREILNNEIEILDYNIL